MPVYRFEHECGYSYDQFLKQDKSTVQLECPRCHRTGTARQVRDNSAKIVEKDGVQGVIRNGRV